jgi:hypothetical protein
MLKAPKDLRLRPVRRVTKATRAKLEAAAENVRAV